MGKFGDAADRSIAAQRDQNRMATEAATRAAAERKVTLQFRTDWMKSVFDPVCDEVNADLQDRGAQLLVRSVDTFDALTVTATLSRAGKPPSQAIIKIDNNRNIRFEGRTIGAGREPLEDAFVEFIERAFGGSGRLAIPD